MCLNIEIIIIILFDNDTPPNATPRHQSKPLGEGGGGEERKRGVKGGGGWHCPSIESMAANVRSLVKRVKRRVVSEEVLAGTEIPGVGRRGRLYLTLLCHHHNDSSIKQGSSETRFNV